jgi:hypothetical protein
MTVRGRSRQGRARPARRRRERGLQCWRRPRLVGSRTGRSCSHGNWPQCTGTHWPTSGRRSADPRRRCRPCARSARLVSASRESRRTGGTRLGLAPRCLQDLEAYASAGAGVTRFPERSCGAPSLRFSCHSRGKAASSLPAPMRASSKQKHQNRKIVTLEACFTGFLWNCREPSLMVTFFR